MSSLHCRDLFSSAIFLNFIVVFVFLYFTSLGFREPIADPTAAGVALACLVLGIFCVSSSKAPPEPTVLETKTTDAPQVEQS